MVVYDFHNPQAWSNLNTCRGCTDIEFPVLAPTSITTGSRTVHTFPISSPQSNFAASNHHASAAYVLESSRICASLGKCHVPAKLVQTTARMANGRQWRTRRAPTLHFFTQPDCLRYVHVINNWDWREHGDGKANRLHLVVSNGGDDPKAP